MWKDNKRMIKKEMRKQSKRSKKYNSSSSDSSDSNWEVGSWDHSIASPDGKSVLEKPKTKRMKLFTRSHLDTLPIKIVTNTTSNLQSDKLLVGNSLNTVILGIKKYPHKPSKRVWRVLLDSGSDGDLIFVQTGLKENVPSKERVRPQKWRTSNGTFRTTFVVRNSADS